jgi:hypothetical protein
MRLKHLCWAPLKDLLMLAVWCYAIFSRSVEWRGIRLRMGVGLVAVGAAGAIALWLLGMWLQGPADDGEAQEALILGLMLLAIAVIGALRLGHYGFQSVLSLDADEKTGRARVRLWRPLGEEAFDTRLSELVEWRYEVARKNTKMPIHRFRARNAEPHRWLVFEISPRLPMHPLLRKLAGKAVDDFEQQTGIAYFRGAQDAAN